MGPGFPRGVRFPVIVILALLVVFLFFFYKSNPAEVKMDGSQTEKSIPDKHQPNSGEMQLNLAQVISGSWPIYLSAYATIVSEFNCWLFEHY